MAIKSINEQHQARRSSYSDGKIKHSRAWLVECDDPRDGPSKALLAAMPWTPPAASGPTYTTLTDEEFLTAVTNPMLASPSGSAYFTGSLNCRVSSLEVEPVKDSDVVFVVVGNYESVDDEAAAIPPLDRPPTFAYSANEYTEPYFLDESTPKRPMANSAGDPFESSSEREQATLVITMNRNEATFSPVEAVEIANTTNAEPILLDGVTYGKDCLKIAMPTAQKQLEYVSGIPYSYYAVTRVFKARRETHVDRLLDVGYNELALVPGPSGSPVIDRVPIVDPAGAKISRPWPLDGKGYAIPSPSGSPAVLERRPYRSVSWTSMSLE